MRHRARTGGGEEVRGGEVHILQSCTLMNCHQVWEGGCWGGEQEEVGGFCYIPYLMVFVAIPWSLSTKESSAVLIVAW